MLVVDFAYIEYKSDPRIETWFTPLVKIRVFDHWLLTNTDCVRSARYEIILQKRQKRIYNYQIVLNSGRGFLGLFFSFTIWRVLLGSFSLQPTYK